MTDLHLALLTLGAIIIAAVIVFNWWQERSLRQEASKRFNEPRRDALMDDFHTDAAAVLKDEPAPEQQPDFDEVSNVDTQESYLEELHDEDHAYGNPATEADSARAEFERDMAEPVAEVASARYMENAWEANEASEALPGKAASAEWMEEAGLDKFVTSDVKLPGAAAPDLAKAHIAHQPPEGQASLPAAIDQQIDFIAMLHLSHVASGAMLREFLLSTTDLDKPIYAYGLDFDGVWRLLTPEEEETEFTRAVCTLQFADRSGPVSSASLDRFQYAVDGMGHRLGAQVEWLGGIDPLRYASELDQFCIEVDKMVGFHLVQGTSGPFTGTKLRGLAEAGGLVLREDGAFHYEADAAHRLFSLINQGNTPFSTEMLHSSAIHGLTFQLDIPRVRNCAEAFNQMVLVARQMESSLSAKLVDDNQRPLGETQIEKIRQQLKIIHAKMIARGIVPGSASALRLFS